MAVARQSESMKASLNKMHAKRWVQARPVCALCLSLSQRPGGPEQERYAACHRAQTTALL